MKAKKFVMPSDTKEVALPTGKIGVEFRGFPSRIHKVEEDSPVRDSFNVGLIADTLIMPDGTEFSGLRPEQLMEALDESSQTEGRVMVLKSTAKSSDLAEKSTTKVLIPTGYLGIHIGGSPVAITEVLEDSCLLGKVWAGQAVLAMGFGDGTGYKEPEADDVAKFLNDSIDKEGCWMLLENSPPTMEIPDVKVVTLPAQDLHDATYSIVSILRSKCISMKQNVQRTNTRKPKRTREKEYDLGGIAEKSPSFWEKQSPQHQERREYAKPAVWGPRNAGDDDTAPPPVPRQHVTEVPIQPDRAMKKIQEVTARGRKEIRSGKPDQVDAASARTFSAEPMVHPGAARVPGICGFESNQETNEETAMAPLEAHVVEDPELVVATPAPVLQETHEPKAMVKWWTNPRNRKLLIAVSLVVITGLLTGVVFLTKSDGGDSTSAPLLPGQWMQLGQDIDGEAAGDYSGGAISLSANGTVVAIGASSNDVNGSETGHVRVYHFEGSEWVQLGSDLDGEGAGDEYGSAVSLSSDGLTVAIGADNNDGNGADSGHARVYHLEGSEWIQLGSDIDGETAGDHSGWSVSLSANGTTLAIGAVENDGNGDLSGHVRVYHWEGNGWILLGSDLDGEDAGDRSGTSVSLSADGTTVAIGADYNNGNGDKSGQVRVYHLEESEWVQLGSDIDGEAAADYFGWSVSLSANGTTVAIGAAENDGNGELAGHVRVYHLEGSEWVQLGTDLDGEAAGDESGYSVSLSADGMSVAIGAYLNDGNGVDSGHVRVYHLEGSKWMQLVGDLDGENSLDWSGWSVSLSADGTIVAIGADGNDGNGEDSGHVRVYRLEQQ